MLLHDPIIQLTLVNRLGGLGCPQAQMGWIDGSIMVLDDWVVGLDRCTATVKLYNKKTTSPCQSLNIS